MEQKHWIEQLKDAAALQKEEQYEQAYSILREMYEQNKVRYDKTIHSNYEDYIEDKVKFFVNLAKLSMMVTDEPARSIPYLDEALIMLDSSESILPYINIADIKKLHADYTALAKA